MKDTAPAMDEKFRTLLLQRSGEERLKMGCSMYATARALVLASLRDREPQASPATLRRELFLRFYGRDFDAGALAKILSALKEVANSETEPRPRSGLENQEAS